ncbi:BCAS3 microtubule associated cell migration factor-like [Halichondria panicea]|uniref:BCAS3 microtubule associated cell migration factor-like n=1 Tax=Halichondria panicea TaxID=6063 RepID=UPI00312B3300
MPGGDAREVYCLCGEGETTRVAKLLPTPQSYKGVTPDKFPEARPIMAVVKKGRHNSGSTVAYFTLQLLSLRTNGGDNTVKKFVFKTRPIVDVHCNRRQLLFRRVSRVTPLPWELDGWPSRKPRWTWLVKTSNRISRKS